jgi:hypothetical protein
MRQAAAAAIGFLVILTNAAQAAPGPAPLLELKARTVSWGLTMPIPPVVNTIVGSLEPARRQQLDICVREQHLQPRNYRGLLLSWAYPSSPGHQLHIVRASERYCGVFYGGQDFNYYLVDEQRGGGQVRFRLLFANHGDRLAILPKVTNGFNEIETAGCNERGCRIARMAFNGRTYRPVQCEESEVRGKAEVRRPRACGSDAFVDDQALTPLPKPRR